MIKKMTFYKQYLETLSTIKNHDYSIILVDFGNQKHRVPTEMMDMDIKIVIGYGSEWKIHEFQPFIDHELGRKFVYILNIGDSEERKWFKTKYGIIPKIMPVIKDPFMWTKVLNQRVEEILGL